RSTLSLANSTIRMAFLAARPMSVIKPICAYILLAIVLLSERAKIAPKAPSGTASNTENGTDQLSYNAAKNRNTKVIENKKIYIVVEPAFISSELSPEYS